jgi:transcriptional regulator with XRE-family HTH domain
MTVSKTIREAVKSSGIELNELTRRTGVPTSVLSRLVTGKTVPSGATIDALAGYYGLTLQPTRKASRKVTASMTKTTATTTKTTNRTTLKGN